LIRVAFGPAPFGRSASTEQLERVLDRVVGRHCLSLGKRRRHEVRIGAAPQGLQVMPSEDCGAPDLLAQGSLVAIDCAE